MQKSTKIIIAGLAVIAVVGIFTIVSRSSSMDHTMSASGTNMSTTEEVPENTIVIQNFKFTKEKLTIERGTTVTWVNRDEARHDVAPTSGPEGFVGSELLSQGETYEFTFNTPGTYTYKCNPHPYMTAEIEVL